MIEGEALVLPPEAAGAAKEFLRVERPDEDMLIGSLAAAAAEACEGFTGQTLLARDFVETVAATRAWQRLTRSPVRAITAVEAVPTDGPPLPLASASYAIDIDAGGDGWARLTGPSAVSRLRVGYRAGLAGAWADLPAALRHGIARLAAHLYTVRVADGARPAGPVPAAVAALWRPYRRLRLR